MSPAVAEARDLTTSFGEVQIASENALPTGGVEQTGQMRRFEANGNLIYVKVSMLDDRQVQRSANSNRTTDIEFQNYRVVLNQSRIDVTQLCEDIRFGPDRCE